VPVRTAQRPARDDTHLPLRCSRVAPHCHTGPRSSALASLRPGSDSWCCDALVPETDRARRTLPPSLPTRFARLLSGLASKHLFRPRHGAYPEPARGQTETRFAACLLLCQPAKGNGVRSRVGSGRLGSQDHDTVRTSRRYTPTEEPCR